ncbi:glycine zipper 2TM domain-containing protein [Halomonas sp. HP20-15]|uniref:glycine zipper 2TM domain-containing protein n=1 Tax=Halomonas sp. HP20-15 TaxID=3085901 RepID=UPI002981FEF3|nr:glycine zipper 2TM domain-containing protein [Halomonas sp. HP20-15]MDW5376888.1 glycine zipper 2TM domain-containing protein [Halomonas sp. HP20-15]
MNKSIVVGGTLAVLGLGGLAFGAYQMNEAQAEPQFARITQVDRVTETVETPREVCEAVAVTHQRPVKDPNRIAGTAVGAIVGGVLGNQVGGGSGKKIATAAGAVAGGLAGREVQQRMQQGEAYTTTEQRCRTVTDSREKLIGYDVEYRVDGEAHTARLDQAPEGDRVAMVDGRPQWHADANSGS